jgi:hypothetical protein
MVIFTETLSELVRGLDNFELVVTEDSITIKSTNKKVVQQAKAKRTPQGKKAVQHPHGEKAVRVARGVYSFDGETRSVKEWAKKYNTTPDVMAHRLMSARGVPYLVKPKTNLKKG